MKIGTTSGNLLIALLLGLAGAMGGAALESTATPARSDTHGEVLTSSALTPEGSPTDPRTILPSRLRIPPANPVSPDVAAKAHVQTALGKLPLYFIENLGQLDERVGYYLQGRDTTVYFTADGVTLALTGPAPEAAKPPRHLASVRTVALESEPDAAGARERWALKLKFLGANPDVHPLGQSPTPAVVSYFKGPREAWKTGLPTYASLVYPDLWPGIDLVYSGTAGRLKYTFLVKPGADPQQIKLAYRGATAVWLTEAGDLAVNTPVGGFRDEKPVSYQEVNGQRVEVATAYALEAEVVSGEHAYGFRLGTYDASRPLVLDPTLIVYAGYIGGAGGDIGTGIAVDGAGNAYVTGYTSSTDFPVLVGPDLTYKGNGDAFVAKVKADGTGLVYAGYIGGAGDDRGYGIAVDGTGSAYVTGWTTSGVGFPVLVGPDLSFNGGAYEAFVAKVRADGTGLVYAGFIGGADGDGGTGIAVDGAGNAYVTGNTGSTEASFPVTVGPDLTFNGYLDAFVAKVRVDGTGLVYAGYIGGADGEIGTGIAVDGAGNAYVTGYTNSTDFPVLGGPDLTYHGNGDAFVAKVKADGTGFVYAGYIGGAGNDFGAGIAVDGAGNAYVTGYTYSADFPVLVGPGLTYKGNGDAFVAKIGTQDEARFLSFPLRNKTAYDAVFSSVFDHSMGKPYCPGGGITTYTGEEGKAKFGISTFEVNFDCNKDGIYDPSEELRGFKNKKGIAFSVGGQYVGNEDNGDCCFLFYDGHPGYDYRTIDQYFDGTLCPGRVPCSDGRTQVLAAAPGIVVCVENEKKCTEGKNANEIKIDHENGYFTIYLHLSEIYARSGRVSRGQIIGISGSVGASSPHLHFEVRQNIGGKLVPVDPYGWHGAGPDPYTRATNQNLWK